MNAPLVENDVEFACASCGREVRKYYVVQAARRDDAAVIIFFKLCTICYINETGIQPPSGDSAS